ncbi:hypothetical protein [Burkholderia ubonensis]|uniref:hypothetical protein n=1 Tax=Burkholderia ubonensis TaxID=101571 RepID=UPI000752E310|nr:hypothetical protein [Burkholderia ubonensis]KVA13755.1 hypothetical protein WI43_25680 [Burkholderia ubonensis]KVA20609.1 hypothetical protein WI42_12855 [Burkholderia ubonensis]KVA54080.1 hypothetical protein WI46_00825 [Burkholderia ubonensis]
MAFYSERYTAFHDTSWQHKSERAHLTLQGRLVKGSRLRGINPIDDANAYVPSFIAMYNARFMKPTHSEFDAHRPLRDDEGLDVVLTWRETRRVTKAQEAQYDRVLYLLDDTPEHRVWLRRDIEAWEYADGRIIGRRATIRH